ncbi:hypothetical protein MA16_Dca027737 [Dendrobium catenatum]|uniref:Uncharacterized protein n=1 Tax=Dendrobium catenatum TaxID=906689 RepID=A0A2I0WEL1_9ASPA|nr:hypothetical protein MA16_Dca027737 [Dendrobium catenatum]
MVTSKSTFPEEIPISLDGDDVNLKVIYDWKPTPCSGCGSLVHPPNLCPKNPQPKVMIPHQARARSKSRPRGRPPLPTSTAPAILPPPSPALPPPSPNVVIPQDMAPSASVMEKSSVPPPQSDPLPNLNLPTTTVVEEPSTSLGKDIHSPNDIRESDGEESAFIPSSPKNNRKNSPKPWVKPSGNLSTSPNKFDPLLLDDLEDSSKDSSQSFSKFIPLSDEPPDPKVPRKSQQVKNAKTKSAKKAQKPSKSK